MLIQQVNARVIRVNELLGSEVITVSYENLQFQIKTVIN